MFTNVKEKTECEEFSFTSFDFKQSSTGKRLVKAEKLFSRTYLLSY